MELTSPTNPPATAGAEGGFWRPRRPGRKGGGESGETGSERSGGGGVCCVCAAEELSWGGARRSGGLVRVRSRSVASGPGRWGGVSLYGHAR